MKLTRRRGRLLGGEPPKRGGRWAKPARAGRPVRGRTDGATILGMLSFALFVLGVVGGFSWAQDRQIRGGVLRQATEAQARPDWVQLDQLPRYVPDSFMAVIEPAIVRAGRLRGGSTGTSVARELVRQVHLLSDGVRGEARAMAMAPLLEQRATRRRTLEIYLNRVALGESRGHPVHGIWHAASEYFGKEPSALTLGEAATLAGLLLPPRITDPQRHVGAVGARRNEVLDVLLRGELIAEEDYRRAVAEPLGFQPGIGDMPMTRPADWGARPDTIRLPEEIRRSLAEPDSVKTPA